MIYPVLQFVLEVDGLVALLLGARGELGAGLLVLARAGAVLHVAGRLGLLLLGNALAATGDYVR